MNTTNTTPPPAPSAPPKLPSLMTREERTEQVLVLLQAIRRELVLLTAAYVEHDREAFKRVASRMLTHVNEAAVHEACAIVEAPPPRAKTGPLQVYVAAPYEDAPEVREVHRKIMTQVPGVRVRATWADVARGPEDLEALGPERVARAIDTNDRDLEAADVVLVLARPCAGGEMFAEVARALAAGTPVIWVGRRILSAYRVGVRRVGSVEAAIALLESMQVDRRGLTRGEATRCA